MGNLFRKIIIPSFVIFSLSFVIFFTGCGDLETVLSSLTVSPSSRTVGINQGEVFTAIGRDTLGMIVDISPTWEVRGGIGEISSTGLFTAGASSGEGYIVATYGDYTASAEVAVTNRGWLEGIVQSSLAGIEEGIKVYLNENTSLLDYSDSEGRYSISDIPAGTYEARTQATVLYQMASQEVTIQEGRVTTWDIILVTQPGVPVTPTTTFPSF